MKFQAKYTEAQWADARRLRAKGLTFAVIAQRLGFATASAVSGRARKENWRAGTAGAKTPSRSFARSGRASPATVRVRHALALRLFDCIDLELRTLELRMTRRLDEYQNAGDTNVPIVPKEEREAFATLIDNINKVTEMASEPALAADGRRKSATLNPELTALSDELDADALAAASQKDELRRDIADTLEKLGPPPASS